MAGVDGRVGRRMLLQGAGLAAGLATLGTPSVAAAAKVAPSSAEPHPLSPLKPDGRLPVNRERAYRMMKSANVDAIIGGTDANSRYLTNMRSIYTDMGHRLRTVGIMPADPAKPIIVITPTVDVGRHAAADREWPEMITYSAPVNPDRFTNLKALGPSDVVEAAPARSWPPSSGTLTPQELAWELEDKARPTAMAANVELGVKKALAELGLTRATVAVDDDALQTRLRRAGLTDLKMVDGENLFRKIRQVKSSVEIDRMRIVARLNDSASRTMMSLLVPGMTFEDVQALFFSEVAKRGGRPEFIVAGMTSGLRHGRLVKHEPFLVDCCGNFDGYSGDFARTVVLGAPPKLLTDRSRLLGRIAVEMTAMLKPGISYREISRRGREMAKKMGADFPIGFTPHSVGLTHSDDPWRDDLPFQSRGEIVLEPGMIITVDLPTLEPGWGSMHLESLILITSSGAEWLDRFDDPLYEVNA
jgi:Xaa-Pro aminopeptidase